MKFVEWSMDVTFVANCNCAFGCPCQFNSDPTDGTCRAYGFAQIEKGRFGEVPLDGLRWGILASWPGAIHEGNGTFQTIVDERANPDQRAAIEAVSHGKETEPGTLIWQVFSTTVTKVLPTLVKNIELSIDLSRRSARVRVPGVIEAGAAPIKNPVTGQEHHATIRLPNGFEYTEAEVVSGTGKTLGASEIKLDFDGTHAHLARVRWSTHGVVR
ncbi:MAG: DUF1326 domain-containing protein [Opitutaceae bacterium]|nr:DUF1326 domain-containing protein [Opitutaceae bacterium]